MRNNESQKAITRSHLQRASGFSLRCAIAALAAGAGSHIDSVTAQNQQPPGERQLVALEEVVVTARRREELLQDIPLAVTALSSEYLRDQNITRVEDLGIHVPSLRISSGGTGTNSPLITLRGQRPSTVTITEDPAVPIDQHRHKRQLLNHRDIDQPGQQPAKSQGKQQQCDPPRGPGIDRYKQLAPRPYQPQRNGNYQKTVGEGVGTRPDIHHRPGCLVKDQQQCQTKQSRRPQAAAHRDSPSQTGSFHGA